MHIQNDEKNNFSTNFEHIGRLLTNNMPCPLLQLQLTGFLISLQGISLLRNKSIYMMYLSNKNFFCSINLQFPKNFCYQERIPYSLKESAAINLAPSTQLRFAENLVVDRTSSKPLAVYTRFSIVFQPCRTRAEKEKVYSRQYSAPILKRKSSRFGLGQLLGSTPPNNSIPGRVALLMLALDVAVYLLCYSMFLHIYIYTYTYKQTYTHLFTHLCTRETRNAMFDVETCVVSLMVH